MEGASCLMWTLLQRFPALHCGTSTDCTTTRAHALFLSYAHPRALSSLVLVPTYAYTHAHTNRSRLTGWLQQHAVTEQHLVFWNAAAHTRALPCPISGYAYDCFPMMPTPKNQSGHIVLSHMWMSHVKHMNESCHIYEWVMSHTWISHVTTDAARLCSFEIAKQHMQHTETSTATYTATHCNVLQHKTAKSRCICSGMSLPTPTKESCQTYGSVMSHIWIRHVTHMNESCHIYDMSYIWMCHVTYMNESCSWRRSATLIFLWLYRHL